MTVSSRGCLELVGWCQVYRNGIVEGVSGDFVSLSGMDGNERRRPVLWHGQREADIFEAAAACVSGLARLGIDPPYAVAISLINAAGSFIEHKYECRAPLEPDIARLEPIVVETALLSGSRDAAFQPIFDLLWNAYGFTYCFSFSADGTWKGAAK